MMQQDANKEPQESERRLRTLISNLPGMVYRCKNDADWTLEFVSEGCFLLTGYHCSELLHNRVSSFGSLIYPDDRQRVWDGIQDALANRRQFQLVYRIRTTTGEERWVWEQGIGIYAKDGQAEALEGFITDITEHKRAEEALKNEQDILERRVQQRTLELSHANEELTIFRKFAEASGEGFGMADLDGRITYVNPTLCRFYGEKAPEDVIGKSVFTYYPEEYRQKRKSQLIPTLLGEGGWQLEQTLVPRHGPPIETWQSTFLIRDEAEMPFRLAVVVSDITQRKRAEAALRNSERRFRDYFEHGLIGMTVTAPDGRWLEVNQRICQILGYRPEELLQKTWTELTHPDDLSSNLDYLHRLLAGDIPHYTLEKRFVRSDGSIVDTTVNIRAFRREDGSIDHIVGLIEDITERKRAEEALRASEAKYRSLFDNMLDGFAYCQMVFDAGGHPVDFVYLKVNEAFEKLTGLKDVAGKRATHVFPGLLQVHPEMLDTFGRVALTGKPETFQLAFQPLGSWLSFAAYSPAHGYFVAVFENITGTKRAQAALQKERRILKHMLQSSDHERQLIAYEIHDGLAQQLAGAIMQFQTFAHLKETKPALATKAYEAGMTMLQQSHFEARRLISGVRPPVLDEAGVAEAIAHLVHEEGRRKVPKIESHCEVHFDRLVPILENAIYRIVQEALTNACNHSQSPRVRISLLQRNNTLCMEIRDWGIGFDPTAIPKNRFGLAGIRERARLLGGKCRIRSKTGQGTSIVVELPVVEREEEP